MKTILIAAVVSLLASILCTPLVVAYFRRRGFGKPVATAGALIAYPTPGGLR